MDDDEKQPAPSGGGLGRFFRGSNGRLLGIGAAAIAVFLLIRYFAQNVTTPATAGTAAAPGLNIGAGVSDGSSGGVTQGITTSSGGGGSSSGGGGTSSSGGGSSSVGGLTFDQWIAQHHLEQSGAITPAPLASTMVAIQNDPALAHSQVIQLQGLYGSGVQHR